MATTDAEQLDRRRRAVEMRLAGKWYEDIGAELGVSKQRAWTIVQDALRDTLREPADRLREVQLARIEALIAARWDTATNAEGNVAALDQDRAVLSLVRLLDRHARYTGIDAPVEVAITEPIAERAARLAGELAAFQAGRQAQAENPDVPANGNGHKKNGSGDA